MRYKRLIIAALAAVLLVGGLGNAFGGVLCLGLDGHLKVEFSQDMRCSDVLSAKDDTRECVGEQLICTAEHSSHCGPCFDIPFGIGDPAKRTKRVFQDFKSPVKTLVASDFFLSSLGSARGRYADKPLPVGDETLASLRTVILLV